MSISFLGIQDTSDRHISAKIADAVKRYKEKRGALPNVCFVSEQDYDPRMVMPPGIKITPRGNIQNNYILVGQA